MARSIELVAGVLAGIVGIVIAAVAGSLGAYWWAVGLFGLGGLGAGLGAYAHVVRGQETWLTVLWASALVMLVMTVLSVFSVGIFLLPGTLSAFVAAGVGTWRSRRGPAGAA